MWLRSTQRSWMDDGAAHANSLVFPLRVAISALMVGKARTRSPTYCNESRPVRLRRFAGTPGLQTQNSRTNVGVKCVDCLPGPLWPVVLPPERSGLRHSEVASRVRANIGRRAGLR